MERLGDKLRRGRLPVVPRCLIHVAVILAAVAIVRHDSRTIFHVEVGLTGMPIVVLTGLHVQLVLLLVTKLSGVRVCLVLVKHFLFDFLLKFVLFMI